MADSNRTNAQLIGAPWNPADTLTSCDNVPLPYFDVLPVDLANVQGIAPPGWNSPHAHTAPHHAMLFYAPVDANNGAIPTVQNQPIVAPGNIVITAVEWLQENGVDDYYITFAPCNEVRFKFHHLTNVGEAGSPLRQRVEEIKSGISIGDLEAWCSNPSTGPCWGLVNQSVTAKTVLGYVWQTDHPAFNISVKDMRADQNPPNLTGTPYSYDRYHLSYDEMLQLFGFPFAPPSSTLSEEITPSRTGVDALHLRCVADYFAPAPQANIRALFGNHSGTLNWTERAGCGQFLYDEPNRIIGNWFDANEPSGFINNEHKMVSFFVDSLSGAGVIAIGRDLIEGNPTSGLNFTFPATTWSNEYFQSTLFVRGGPQHIYCYDFLQPYQRGGSYNPGLPAQNGVVLVQFQDSESVMKIQYRADVADCSLNPEFTGAEYIVIR